MAVGIEPELIFKNVFSLVADNAVDNIEPVPLQDVPHVHIATGGLPAQETELETFFIS
jgi:hypothetical protein